jgi:glyoxylase-like metal-dependent hydrolase (beta-lactamase superfamily II)
MIKTIKVGYLQTNCYILIKDNNALIIDPGDEAEKIKEATKDLNIEAILITHHHFDHVGALEEFKNIEIIDYKNKKTKTKSFEFEIIETKGHTEDSISFYFEKEKIMFVGDFVFEGSIGRTDLETGNMEEMEKSIQKLKTYPKDIELYPGHGNKTTLEIELENNPFF